MIQNMYAVIIWSSLIDFQYVQKKKKFTATKYSCIADICFDDSTDYRLVSW